MGRTAVNRSGLTLTEILIALFLFGLIGIILGNLDLFVHRSVQRSSDSLWLNQEPRRLMDWLSRDVIVAESIELFNNTTDGDGWPEKGGGASGAGNGGECR